jgi:hypothetical protein
MVYPLFGEGQGEGKNKVRIVKTTKYYPYQQLIGRA